MADRNPGVAGVGRISQPTAGRRLQSESTGVGLRFTAKRHCANGLAEPAVSSGPGGAILMPGWIANIRESQAPAKGPAFTSQTGTDTK